MCSRISNLLNAVYDALGGDNNDKSFVMGQLFGRVRVQSNPLEKIPNQKTLIDSWLCGKRFFPQYQLPFELNEYEHSALSELRAGGFTTTTIQSSSMGKNNDALLQKFTEGFFLPSPDKSPAELMNDDVNYTDRFLGILDTLEDEINFYEELRDSQENIRNDYMLDVFRRLIPIWTAKGMCGLRFYLDGNCVYIDEELEDMEEDVGDEEVPGDDLINAFWHSYSFYGAPIWDCGYWRWVLEVNEDAEDADSKRIDTIIERIADEKAFFAEDVADEYKKLTKNEWENYVRCMGRRMCPSQNGKFILGDMDGYLRRTSVRVLYERALNNELRLPDVVVHKSNFLFNIFIGSVLGIGHCVLPVTRPLLTDFAVYNRLPYKEIVLEDGEVCITANIRNAHNGSSSTEEIKTKSFQSGAPELLAIFGRGSEGRVPYCVNIEEKLLCGTSELFDVRNESHPILGYIDEAIKELFGNDFNRNIVDRINDGNNPICLVGDDIEFKLVKRNDDDNARNIVDIEEIEILRRTLRVTFEQYIKEGLVSYSGGTDGKIRITGRGIEEVSPAPLAEHLKTCCGKFVTKFGISNVAYRSLNPGERTNFSARINERIGCAVEQYVNNEKFGCKCLIEEISNNRFNPGRPYLQDDELRVIETSRIAKRMYENVLAFCGENNGAMEESAVFKLLWSFVSSGINAWAKNTRRILDFDSFSRSIMNSVNDFRKAVQGLMCCLPSAEMNISAKSFCFCINSCPAPGFEHKVCVVPCSQGDNPPITIVVKHADTSVGYVCIGEGMPRDGGCLDQFRNQQLERYRQSINDRLLPGIDSYELVENPYIYLSTGDTIFFKNIFEVTIN